MRNQTAQMLQKGIARKMKGTNGEIACLSVTREEGRLHGMR